VKEAGCSLIKIELHIGLGEDDRRFLLSPIFKPISMAQASSLPPHPQASGRAPTDIRHEISVLSAFS
jgi:hypothetical protein